MVEFTPETIGPEVIRVNGSCARLTTSLGIRHSNNVNCEKSRGILNPVFIFTGQPTPKPKPYNNRSTAAQREEFLPSGWHGLPPLIACAALTASHVEIFQ